MSSEDYKRRIYLLDSSIPEEVVAVAFAKCSRDPRPFDDIAAELNADKARRFHEKWVLDYGHGSVAEHAVAHIAIENVSILATKVIEDTRLASYTEKSTRYQVMEAGKCFRPLNLSPGSEVFFDAAVEYLFEVYAAATEKVDALMRQKLPMEQFEIDNTSKLEGKTDAQKKAMYETTIKGKTCDVTRYLLPAGTMTQLGMTVNARSLEHCLSKLLSHPLQEMRDIGKEMKEVALKELPTLVKYASENDFMKGFSLDDIVERIPAGASSRPVELVRWDSDAMQRVVSALLFRNSNLPYSAVAGYVAGLKPEERAAVIERVMQQRGAHDAAPREFEEALFTFDVLVDYGAYRDIQRHRIMSQTPQHLTVEHGYELPEEFKEVGLADEYRKAMGHAANAFDVIKAESPLEAQYIVPLGYKTRLLMTMNLREVFHFTELRSGKRGHQSYRKIAQQMADEVIGRFPELGKHLRIDRS